MKRVFIIAALCNISLTFLSASPLHEILIEPHWEDLYTSPRHIKQFDGKWVWSGTFTFKKRSREPIGLHDLDITWQGEQLAYLEGSLFKKEPGKQFYPIEDAHISDAQWKPKDQTLHFHFNEKENLKPVTIFCLVLTIPQDLEQKLKRGRFTLNHASLPDAFKKAVQKQKLSFTLRPPQDKETHKVADIKKSKVKNHIA